MNRRLPSRVRHAVILGILLALIWAMVPFPGSGPVHAESTQDASEASITLSSDGAVHAGRPLVLAVELAGPPVEAGELLVDGEVVETLQLEEGTTTFEWPDVRLEAGRHTIGVRAGGAEAEIRLRAIQPWWSILPPLAAIVLALLFREVLLSLFVGILFGSFLLFDFDVATAFARTIDRFIVDALADGDHASILIFSSLLGGMVGVITRSGGTQGIVAWLAKYATTGRRGMLATWAMGLFVFFDDYANTLIVGSTMRPVTDRLKISREKLAYIVDSTAAPVACLAPVSTWVGYEVGLIGEAFRDLEIPYDPYGTFLASIPYLFYPILALVMVGAVAWTRRDLGPMLGAERRAHRDGDVVSKKHVPLADFDNADLQPTEDMPLRAANALLPILTVIGVTLYGIVHTGRGAIEPAADATWFETVRDIFSNANSYAALLWGSLSGVVVAVLLSVATPKVRIPQTMTALAAGLRSMLLALIVLILAWGLGAVCGELHTADYLVSITEGVVSPAWIPVLTFLIAAAVAFATGTSWATMAILMPLVIPIAHELSIDAGHSMGDGTYRSLLLGTIASVLAGSVWGDHCSPISDTTILSSMASGCDHIAHVRTQIPYAMTAGLLGIGVSILGTSYGVPVFATLPVAIALVVLLVRFVFRPVEG